MFKVARIVFAIYFTLLFARAAFGKDACGNNGERNAHTVATATPAPGSASSSSASQPKSDGQHHGVKR